MSFRVPRNRSKSRIGWSTTLFLFILILSSCTSYLAVRESRWKYAEGYHIGDILNFKEGHPFRIDTKGRIYKDGIPSGKVIEITSNDLIIESLAGQKGIYVLFD